jgi:hypothetical protein
MNRIGRTACFVGMCLTAIVSVPAVAQEGSIPACQLGLELRNALGFGPKVLAVVGVDAATYDSIVLAATSFCDSHRATIEPLLADVRSAQQDAFRQYELNSDQIETADGAVLSAINVLAAQSGEVVGQMDGYLTTQQAAQRANAAANVLLDATLAVLDLTQEQYSQVLSAQRDRDRVFKHHQQRKDPVAVKEAYDAFVTAIGSILTSEQQTAYAGFANTLSQNIGPLTTEEDTLCPR